MKATFRVYWQVGTDVTVELPDNIDTNNESEVRQYLDSAWRKMRLPENAKYIPKSDEIDFDRGVIITD